MSPVTSQVPTGHHTHPLWVASEVSRLSTDPSQPGRADRQGAHTHMVWKLIRVNPVLLALAGLMGGTGVRFWAKYAGSLVWLITPVVGSAPGVSRTLMGTPLRESVNLSMIVTTLRAR